MLFATDAVAAPVRSSPSLPPAGLQYRLKRDRKKNGKKFELRFDSDGSPMTLRRIRRTRAGGPPVMSPFD
jgi:hypothetical protein